MIGMAIGPVRDADDARTVTADEGDGLNKVLRMFTDFSIGPAQVFAPGGTKDLARRFRFGQPLVHGPVAAHLAGGQIAQPDAQAERRMMSNRAAQADFEIVRMRAEDEKIDGHQRVNSNALSDGSSSSR